MKSFSKPWSFFWYWTQVRSV